MATFPPEQTCWWCPEEALYDVALKYEQHYLACQLHLDFLPKYIRDRLIVVNRLRDHDPATDAFIARTKAQLEGERT